MRHQTRARVMFLLLFPMRAARAVSWLAEPRLQASHHTMFVRCLSHLTCVFLLYFNSSTMELIWQQGFFPVYAPDSDPDAPHLQLVHYPIYLPTHVRYVQWWGRAPSLALFSCFFFWVGVCFLSLSLWLQKCGSVYASSHYMVIQPHRQTNAFVCACVQNMTKYWICLPIHL